MTGSCQVEVGRANSGYFVRVAGRGTLRESAALHDFVAEALRVGPANIVIDLGPCDYLDSTFLGCLIDIFKQTRKMPASRLVLVRPSPACMSLLEKTRLATVLTIEPDCDEPESTMVPLARSEEDPREPDMGRHIRDCHRRLADLGGPNQAVFAAIADQLDRELAK